MTFWRISLCKHYQNWYSSKWYRQETEPASPGWADHCFVMKINNPPNLPRARRLNVIVKSNKRGTLEQHWNDFRKFILNLRYVEAISCQLHLKHPTLKPKSPPSPAHSREYLRFPPFSTRQGRQPVHPAPVPCDLTPHSAAVSPISLISSMAKLSFLSFVYPFVQFHSLSNPL